MFGGLFGDVKERLGATLRTIAWGTIAAVAAVAALFFFAIAAYVWLAHNYGTVAASLVMAGFFLLVAIIAAAVVAGINSGLRRRRRRQADRASMIRDPMLLATGLQLARGLGAKRLVPLVLLGSLAAGWLLSGLGPAPDEDAEEDEEV